jgi:hypothetical protein
LSLRIDCREFVTLTKQATHVEDLHRQVEALQSKLVELATERKVKAGETLPSVRKRVEKKAIEKKKR